MSEDKLNMFKALAEQRKQKLEPTAETQPKTTTQKSSQKKTKSIKQPELSKRGRPATGKRSNPDWIGRTYYIKKETDLDVEGALFDLKRKGVDVDKSELVDFLLGEWVKSQQGEKATFQIGENT